MAELKFTVDSALLSEIGERLVESVHIALLELVKNAYDADAFEVTVSIIPYDEIETDNNGKEQKVTKYKITVEDNGNGMTFNDVEKYWMRIATTNKAGNTFSKRYGRPVSGAKGIGRFSCRRLGPKITLETTGKRPDGKFETTSFSIDWSQYKPGIDITEIKCKGTKSTAISSKTGTTLVIEGGLANEWSHTGWKVLKRRLILLVSNRGVSRDGYENDPGFDVLLEAPDFEDDVVIDQLDELMESGWGRLELEVFKDGKEKGKAKWTLTAKRIGKKQKTMEGIFPNFIGVKADISIIPEVKSHLRNPSAIAMSLLRERLNEWGGVKIRVNGIRIPPYGEGKNDWLAIDRDRGTRLGKSPYCPAEDLVNKLRGVDPSRFLLNMLSANHYVGEVNINTTIFEEEKPIFEMRTSREGFVGERPIEQLRKIIRYGIDWSTIYRDFYIRELKKDEAREARDEFSEVTKKKETNPAIAFDSALDYVSKEVKQIASTLPTAKRQEVFRNIDKATKVLSSTDKLHRDELQHLRLVASTSSLLLIFQHEVKALLSSLSDYEVKLGNIGRLLKGDVVDQISNLQEYFRTTKTNFNDLLNLTSMLSLPSDKTDDARIALFEKVERAKNCFRLISSKYDIDIDLSNVPKSLKVGPITEPELFSVFLNIFSNSIKSVIAKGGKKLIRVETVKDESGAVRINIFDNGIGIPKDSDELFISFVSDPKNILYKKLAKNLNPEDKYIVGPGSGLGLGILKEIIEYRKGSIRFIRAEKPWSANLEITLT